MLTFAGCLALPAGAGQEEGEAVRAESEERGWQDLEDGDAEERGEEEAVRGPGEPRPLAPPLDLELPLLPAPAPADKVRVARIGPKPCLPSLARLRLEEKC